MTVSSEVKTKEWNKKRDPTASFRKAASEIAEESFLLRFSGCQDLLYKEADFIYAFLVN